MIKAELKGIKDPQRFVAMLKQEIQLHLFDDLEDIPHEFRREYVIRLMRHIGVLRETVDDSMQPQVDEAVEYTRGVTVVDEELPKMRRLAVEGPDDHTGRLLEYGNSEMAASGIVRQMNEAYKKKILDLLKDTVVRMRETGNDAKGTII